MLGTVSFSVTPLGETEVDAVTGTVLSTSISVSAVVAAGSSISSGTVNKSIIELSVVWKSRSSRSAGSSVGPRMSKGESVDNSASSSSILMEV